MKILVVCQYYYPEPFRITDICETLVERGHQITVLTGLPNYPEGKILPEYKYGNKRKEILNGVNVIRCPEISRGKNILQLFINYISFTISGSVKVLFIKDKFDVVLVNQLSPVLMAVPAIIYKKIRKTKVLLYCLDLWPDSLAAGGVNANSFIYKCFISISRWIYSSVDLIMVTSNMFKDYFKDVLQINDIEIKYLPQYAEDLFVESNNTYVYRDNNSLDLVFAGNIGEMQGVETIIYAANELKDDKKIKFHIVGDGSKLQACKILSEKMALKNIYFYGRRPLSEMSSFYGMADAMLVTLKGSNNIDYTVPGKVQTYMAAGKPIIGSINGETQKIINDSRSGYCCDGEDFKELANLLIRFKVTIPENKKKMAQNSYNYYLNNFSKDKFFCGLENGLESMEDS
jgi:glycosyltransferase involved in cell wall biosynthesis